MGNVIPPYSTTTHYSEQASLEFALDDLKIRNIIICAHTECCSVKSALHPENHHTQSELSAWLDLIRLGEQRLSPEDNHLDSVKLNALNQVANIKTYPQVQALLAAGELQINVWVYDVHSSDMLCYDAKEQRLVPLIP
jgi:carbonic anhydrase